MSAGAAVALREFVVEDADVGCDAVRAFLVNEENARTREEDVDRDLQRTRLQTTAVQKSLAA